MTPVQQAGYSEGQQFVVKEDAYGHSFSIGSLVELEHDDGSDVPLFKLIKGSCRYNNAAGNEKGAYAPLNCVEPIQTVDELVEENISLAKQIDRLTEQRLELEDKARALAEKIERKQEFYLTNSKEITARLPEEVKKFAPYIK